MPKDIFQLFHRVLIFIFFPPEATCKYEKQNLKAAELDPWISVFENLTHYSNYHFLKSYSLFSKFSYQLAFQTKSG